MKFGEQLASHLTPEWRKQYIRYEELKTLLYDIVRLFLYFICVLYFTS
jgi:xenotropic and polytropic retrovirus receptor 1